MKSRNVLLLIPVVIAAACRGRMEEPTGEGYHELEADRIMVGARITPTEDGIRKALGVFDTVYVYDDSSTYNVKGVKLDIYNVEGRPAAHVTSERGRLNIATDAMTAIGDVVLITPDNVRIETEELHYDPTAHRIWSDVETRQVTPDGKQSIADSFSTNDDFTDTQFVHLRGDIGALRMNSR
jgi:LPS export ABC transporter protein LptC